MEKDDNNKNYSDDDNLNKCMKIIMSRFRQVEEKIEKLFKVRNCMEDDDLLDNQDLCHLLNVSKRTLQRYRQKKIIKYHMINDGKAYYKKSELPDFLFKKE